MSAHSVLLHSRVAYEIIIRGTLAHNQSTWFGPAAIAINADGTTRLMVVVADQSELHGILNRIRDLGLVLMTVRLLDHES